MAIDNWTKFPLIEPQTDLKCGKVYGTMPTTIIPGTSEMVIFEKGVRKTKYPTFECIKLREIGKMSNLNFCTFVSLFLIGKNIVKVNDLMKA